MLFSVKIQTCLLSSVEFLCLACGLGILFEVVLCKSVPLVHQCQRETETPRHSRQALSQRSQAQKKLFNRSNFKISYGFMNNTKQIIDNHHKRILTASIQTDDTAATTAAPTKTCNYRRKNTSPLDGNCLQSPVIYQATVTRKDNSIRKKRTSDVYFVNKPLSAAGISEDNALG